MIGKTVSATNLIGSALIAGLVLCAGCASQSARTPQPALLTVENQSEARQAETRKVLESAASTLLRDVKITLGYLAFTQTPTLSLSPAIRNTPKGRLATGRSIVLPTELQLLRIGRSCALMNLGTRERVQLPTVKCRVASVTQGPLN